VMGVSWLHVLCCNAKTEGKRELFVLTYLSWPCTWKLMVVDTWDTWLRTVTVWSMSGQISMSREKSVVCPVRGHVQDMSRTNETKVWSISQERSWRKSTIIQQNTDTEHGEQILWQSLD
jgi:hypothetical protein